MIKIRQFGNSLKRTVSKIITLIENMNLRNKLMLSYLIILVIPILFMSMYIFNSFSKDNNIKIVSENKQSIKALKRTVEYNIQKCIMDSNMMLKRRDLVNYFHDCNNFAVQRLIDFKNTTIVDIESVPYVDPDIHTIRFFINDPNLYEIYPIIYNTNKINNLLWYKNLLKSNKNYLWNLNHNEEVFVNTSNIKSKIVSCYSKIQEIYDENPIGVCEVSMDISRFFYPMYSNKKNSDNFMTVIQGGKNIYADKDNYFLCKNKISLNSVKNALLLKKHKTSGDFNAKLCGKRINVAYEYIKELDSYIYSVISTEKVISQIDKFRNEVLFGAVGLIIMFIIIIYMVTGAVLNKLEVLVNCMRSVQNGNLNVEIPISGKDEIGEVGYHFKKTINRLKELIGTIVKKEALTKDAEIRALQTQINAHFLYNALETIKMMAVIDYKYEIADALTILGSIMRYSISWSRKYVLVEEEIEHIKNYVQLLNLRYSNGLQLKLNIEDKIFQQEILKMTIQPIVENAVNYGIEVKGHDGVISIDAYGLENVFYIKITDNGVGMSEEQVKKLNEKINGITDEEAKIENKNKLQRHNGIGLKNVNERIKIFYGNEYGIQVMSKLDEYTSVLVKLPYSKAFEGELN